MAAKACSSLRRTVRLGGGMGVFRSTLSSLLRAMVGKGLAYTPCVLR